MGVVRLLKGVWLIVIIIIIIGRQRVLAVIQCARFKIWGVVKSNVFFWFMVVIIFLNLIILLCDHYNSPLILDQTISKL